MIATATTIPVPARATTGAPVTAKAAAIAAHIADLEARYAAMARTSCGTREECDTLHSIADAIARQTARYDYYNWRP